MDKTKIEWADASLNPVRARHRETGKIGWFCTHASPGCGDSTGGGCYAEAINRRLGTGIDYQAQNVSKVEMYLDEKILASPLRWARGRRIFWNSMSDTFGDFVPDTWIDRMFAVCALTPQHQHLFLTKRAERMRDYLSYQNYRSPSMPDTVCEVIGNISGLDPRKTCDSDKPGWPLSNVWLGVSVEDQRRADERIPLLLETPAAVRWISAEPLLGPVSLNGGRGWLYGYEENGIDMTRPVGERVGACIGRTPPLDWVVCGGESGPGARLFSIDWARSIIAQCREAGVPCFIKQLGARPTADDPAKFGNRMMHDRKGGDISEWPEDLRIREYPKSRDG